jgi:hypothetical protein
MLFNKSGYGLLTLVEIQLTIGHLANSVAQLQFGPSYYEV